MGGGAQREAWGGMWFDDHDDMMSKHLSLNRRRVFKGKPVNVSVRLRAQRASRANRWTLIALGGGVIVAALWLAGVLVVSAGRALFSSNERFTITRLDIRSGKMMGPDLIKEYTKIREGDNLFGFSIGRVRRDFLRRAPHVKSMGLARQLPDTLKIEVVEREAVARLGGRDAVLVVDREGFVFVQRSSRSHLPVISGCREGSLRPGESLGGPVRAALEVLDASDDPRLAFQVDTIDVSRDDYVLVYLPYGGRSREVKLAWIGMGSGTAESGQQLLQKLGWVLQFLQSEEGKRHNRIDATLEGGRVYGQ